jgi:formate dehydrogenase iron-sulfur subunit
VEKAFGLTLRELLDDFGGGSARPAASRGAGGRAAGRLPAALAIRYAAGLRSLRRDRRDGRARRLVARRQADMAKLARYAMEFCAVESCGKCTPCRIGSTRGVEVIDRSSPTRNGRQIHLLRDLCDTMLNGSLCAMGGMTPFPVLSALNHFPEDFGAPGEQAA